MFRFFRKDTLRSTRRRSASCPNLEHASLEGESPRVEEQYADDDTSTESDTGEKDSPTKFERLKAQRSIRRVRQKEKEKQENAEKNLISMDDYLGKLSELKTWLKEERKKDVDSMRSPKLKAHFRTFIKLWNKRKLPARFYRSCSVDQENEDTPSSPVYPEVITEQQPLPRYPLLEDPATPATPVFPLPVDLSTQNAVEEVGSPFSTFGKCLDDPFSSPALLMNEVRSSVTTGAKCNKEESSPHSNKESHSGQSSNSNGSPQKFATISRSTPASTLYKFSAQPWTNKGDLKIHPVSSPRCPELPSTAPSSNFPARTLPHSFAPGNTSISGQKDKWVSGWNKATGESPVYASVIDAIPYSTESPKYYEIEEFIAQIQDDQSSPGYCSLSPFEEWKTSRPTGTKTGDKKTGFNRRRSKSMEDIYAVPVKFTPFREKKQLFLEGSPDMTKAPPIPDKKYSPKHIFSTFLGQKGRKQTIREFDRNNHCSPQSSSIAGLPAKSPDQGNSPQKRRSEEGAESEHNSTSPLKKTRSNLMLNLSRNNSVLSTTHTVDQTMTTSDIDEAPTPSKLSILTGSMNPTTRSKFKLNDSVNPMDTDNTEDNRDSDLELSILEIKQLDESPKFPRRKLKRRSSSFSTTPGKGLTFGKTSKKSTASPRRVSFSKDVKDTDGSTTPSRRRSSREAKTAVMTKQTQERMEFESFLSSHVSPPQGSNSPARVPSPASKVISPSRNLGGRIYSPPGQNVTQARFDENKNAASDRVKFQGQSTGGPIVKGASSKLVSSLYTNTDGVDNNSGNRFFPAIPTRQAGRRVIGPPVPVSSQKTATKMKPPSNSPQKTPKSPEKPVSPQRKIFTHLKQLSPPKKLFDSQISLSAPKKSIHSLVTRITDKTASICATEVSESEGYSSNDEMLDVKEATSSTENVVCDPFVKTTFTSNTDLKTQNTDDNPTSDQVSKLCITTETNPKPKRQDSPVGKGEFEVLQLEISPGSKNVTSSVDIPDPSGLVGMDSSSAGHLKHNENTNLKISLKDTDRPSSNGQSGTLTESLAWNSSQEIANASLSGNVCTSESSLLDEINSVMKKKFLLNQSSNLQWKDVAQTSVSSSETLHVTSTGSVEVPDSKGSVSPASSFLAEFTDASTELKHFSSSTNLDQTNDMFTVSELRAFEKEAKLWNKRISSSSSKLHMQVFPAKPEAQDKNHSIHVTRCNQETQKLKSEETKAPQGIEHNLVTVSEEFSHQNAGLEVKGSKFHTQDGDINSDDNSHDVSKFQRNFTKTCALGQQHEANSPSINKLPVHSKSSFDNSSTDNRNIPVEDTQESLKSQKIKKDRGCNLERLESIKASPKIVDNDGWVTQRRRSSKGKLHSFRSAYNRYLLRSSSKEEETETESTSESVSGNGTAQTTIADKDEDFSRVEPAQTGAQELTQCQVDQVQGDNKFFRPFQENKELSAISTSDTTLTVNWSENEELPSGPVMTLPVPDTMTLTPDEASHSDAALLVEGNLAVQPMVKPKAPTPQKKPKVKPPTLPKTFKSSAVLSKKRLNVANFVTAIGNSNTKRRSSLVKKDEMQLVPDQSEKGHQNMKTGEPKEDYVKKNIGAVRRVSTKGSSSSPKWSKFQQAGQSGRKRSSVGESPGGQRRKSGGGGRRDSQEGKRRESGGRRDSQGGNRRESGGRRDSQGGNKRESLKGKRRDSKGNGRRRSKGTNGEDENKMPSFMERRKFFQQLQSKAESGDNNSKAARTHSYRSKTASTLQKQICNSALEEKKSSTNINPEKPKWQVGSEVHGLAFKSSILPANTNVLAAKGAVCAVTSVLKTAPKLTNGKHSSPVSAVTTRSCAKIPMENCTVFTSSSKNGTPESNMNLKLSPQAKCLRSTTQAKCPQEQPGIHISSPEKTLAHHARHLRSPSKPHPYPKPCVSEAIPGRQTLKASSPKKAKQLTLSPHSEMRF